MRKHRLTRFTFIAIGFVLLLIASSCKKDTSATATHPYAGTYAIQNQANGYSLKYLFNSIYHGIDVGGADSMLVIPGTAAGEYYIISKVNIDKYLDTDNQCCTFVKANDFNNSTSQLFTIEPIYEGATRYYIKSVKTPSILLSSYRTLGSYSSLFFHELDATENGATTLAQIWVLNKL
jgi:hypothetical protein